MSKTKKTIPLIILGLTIGFGSFAGSMASPVREVIAPVKPIPHAAAVMANIAASPAVSELVAEAATSRGTNALTTPVTASPATSALTVYPPVAGTSLLLGDTVAEKSEPPLQGRTILIDPGHGGKDPGASRAGFEEKTLTLAVSRDLRDKLQQLGAQVDMTRSTDQSVSLQERLADSNSLCPDAFVSVHANVVGSSSISGIETYYFGERSSQLSQLALEKLSTDLRDTAKWSHNRDLFVLDGNRVPATLAEIGYISNAASRARLETPSYQEKVAAALADTLVTYFQTPGSPRGCFA